MSHWRALLVAVLCSSLLVPAAKAAAPAPPLQALHEARQELQTLAGSVASQRTRSLLDRASNALALATVPSLWVDPTTAVAPPAGHAVFAHSRAALQALEPLLAASTPPHGVAAPEALILGADRRLAVGAIRQAAGGTGLLVRAEGMIISGDRWAATSRVDLAAEQYGVAWVSAFGALTPLVVTPATNVPPAALGNAAEAALATHQISLSHVHSIANKPPLTESGLPVVLLVAPTGCAACALESWGIVEALSQFGVFSNLALSQSATTRHPIVRGFTFHGSSYGSPFVAFAGAAASNGVPRPLPFIDVANKFADVGSPASPAVADRMSWSQLAGSEARPKTATGQAIDGTAELLTAEICEATGGAPAEVCGTAAVKHYESRLPPAAP
jgi:hypothetical protein